MLTVLGLCLGSFVNALVWRIRKKKDWVKARSQCTHCGHILNSIDLIPVISWVMLRGKCRFCKKQISVQYPTIELAAAIIFVVSYIYWPGNLDQTSQIVLLAAWLTSVIGLLALLIYDFRWTLLPNKLIYPTLLAASMGNLIYLLFANDKISFITNWLLSIIVASGVFFVLFMISNGKWIGYGDVRLGLITGTLLHSPRLSFLMIFLASILGTLFVAPSLVKKSMSLGAKLPFGPFLIVSTAICLLFGNRIFDWYLGLFSI